MSRAEEQDEWQNAARAQLQMAIAQFLFGLIDLTQDSRTPAGLVSLSEPYYRRQLCHQLIELLERRVKYRQKKREETSRGTLLRHIN
jgi:hypothetical protein